MDKIEKQIIYETWTPKKKHQVGQWYREFAQTHRGWAKSVVLDVNRRRTAFRVVREYLFEGESQRELSDRYGVNDVSAMVKGVLIRSKLSAEGRLKTIDTTTRFPKPGEPVMPGVTGPGIGEEGKRLTGPPDLSHLDPETIDWLTGKRAREDLG